MRIFSLQGISFGFGVRGLLFKGCRVWMICFRVRDLFIKGLGSGFLIEGLGMYCLMV